MSAHNDIIHQPVRLKIMASLNVLPKGEAVEFVRLKAIVEASDGNLGAHIATLEKAGYVEVLKDFHANRPRTRVILTAPGRKAFAAHVAHLKSLLGDSL